MFNSPFPPLKPTIKYKTAFERAGFDVNASANNSMNTTNDTKNHSFPKSNNMDSPNSTFMDDSANSILLVNKSLQKKQKLLIRKQQEQQAALKNKSKQKKGNKNKNVLDELSPPKMNSGSSSISIASQNSSIKTGLSSITHLKVKTDQKPPVSAVFGLNNPSTNTSFTAINNNQSNVISNNSAIQEADISHVSNLNISNDELSKIQNNKSKDSLLNKKIDQTPQLASESFIQQWQEQEEKYKTKEPKEEEFKREITPPIHTINNLADLQFDQESFYSEIQSQDPRNNNIDDQSDERLQFISDQPQEASKHSSYQQTSSNLQGTALGEEDNFDFNEEFGESSAKASQLDLNDTKKINPSEIFLDHHTYYDNEFPEGKLTLENEKHIPPSGLTNNTENKEQELDVSKMESLNISKDHDIFNPSEESEHFENMLNEEKFNNADEATGTFFSAKDFIETNEDVEELNFDSPEKNIDEYDDYEGKTKDIDTEFEKPLNFEDNDAEFAKEEETPVTQQNQFVGEDVCRGCLNEIKPDEKTIHDKNGELSGKWHKKCFSCKQCNIKFSRKTPCYIHDDEPFCEEHFFEVTGLICFGCKNRILDDYCLDVMVLGKAHIGCFKCNDCGVDIQDEYFSNEDVNICVNCVRKRGAEEKMQKRRTVLWDAN